MEGTNHSGSDDRLRNTFLMVLERWTSRFPKSVVRLVLLFFAFGAGLGIELTAANLAISWHRNRPLPQKKWSESSFGAVGLKAKLSTKWEGYGDELKYRVSIAPIDSSRLDDFNRIFSSSRFDKFTVNLYDSSHFLVGSEDINLSNFTGAMNDAGVRETAVAQGKFYISRDEYKSLSSWDFSTNLPIAQKTPAQNNSGGVTRNGSSPSPLGASRANPCNPQKQGPSGQPLEGDDVISGYSVLYSRIETSGGLTFFVYKEGERQNAIVWGVDSAPIHYQCDRGSLCTLKRSATAVILHAKLQKSKSVPEPRQSPIG